MVNEDILNKQGLKELNTSLLVLKYTKGSSSELREMIYQKM
jgi:hypothetical protein